MQRLHRNRHSQIKNNNTTKKLANKINGEDLGLPHVTRLIASKIIGSKFNVSNTTSGSMQPLRIWLYQADFILAKMWTP